MNKVFCALIAIFSAMILFADIMVFAEIEGGLKYNDELGVLEGLAVMTADKVDDTMTRAEFASVVIRMLGLESVAEADKGQQAFADVPQSHLYSAYVNLAVRQGIIKGDGDNFMPDKPIAFEECVKLLVNAIGCEAAANARGGFPAGYLSVGAERGITKGIGGYAGKSVTKRLAAKLVFNAMNAERMADTGNGKYQNVKTTLLQEIFNVYKYSGIVTSDGFSTFAGRDNLEADEVTIDMVVYKAGNTNVRDFLGYNITFWYKEVDADTRLLLYTKETDNANNVVSVLKQDIMYTDPAFSENCLVYADMDGVRRNAEIETSAALYNGAKVKLTADLLRLQQQSDGGRVLLIDTDNNSKYDKVIIYEYNNIVVDSIDTENYNIFPKNGLNAVNLPLNNKSCKVLITMDNKPFAFDKLREWDVLSLAVNSNIYKVTVSRKKVSGRIEEITDDGQVIISDRMYTTSPSLAGRLKAGDSGSFYIDKYGTIAAVNDKIDAGTKYYYLLRATKGNGLDKAQLKLVVDDGSKRVFNIADKIRYDNGIKISIISGDDLIDMLKDDSGKVLRQLIMANVNQDGEVTSVSTAKAGADVDKFSLDLDSGTDSYTCLDGKYFNVKYSIKPGSTVTFSIPDDVEDDDSYTVNPSLVSKAKYSIKLYDLNEIYQAKAAVIQSSDFSTFELKYSPLAVIDSVSDYFDTKTQTNKKKINMYLNGSPISVIADIDQFVDTINITQLNKGDVIQVVMSDDKKIKQLRKIYTGKDKYLGASVTDVNADAYNIFGTVDKFMDSQILIKTTTISGMSDIVFDYKTSDKITLIDTRDPENYKISTPTAGSIVKNDTVIVRKYNRAAVQIVVIR